MAGKKISEMTLKNTIVDADVFTILDSEASYENKKILASSIVSKQKEIINTYDTIVSLDIEENTVYKWTQPVTSMTLLTTSTSLLETEIDFTTGSTFSFTATGLTGKWINQNPNWQANTHYIICIKNGYAVWGEIV